MGCQVGCHVGLYDCVYVNVILCMVDIQRNGLWNKMVEVLAETSLSYIYVLGRCLGHLIASKAPQQGMDQIRGVLRGSRTLQLVVPDSEQRTNQTR